MVRVYCAARDIIGYISTGESCQLLFYFCFAAFLNGTDPRDLPAICNQHTIMSPEWKEEVQHYIFFHLKTRSVSMLLPQDEDLELNHWRGNTFLATVYWIKCSTRNHILFAVGNAVETDINGNELLELPSAIKSRKEVIKFKNSKCACGKTKKKSDSSAAVVEEQ